MQLRLISKKDNDPNNIIYLTSTEFFMKELLGRNTFAHVERLYIKVEANMGNWGECTVRKLKNGNMTVRIKFRKSLNFIETLTTIAHECVHAKQFITGQLHINRRDIWMWKGKSYGTDPYRDLTADTYYILPWEREALRKQSTLVMRYLSHYYIVNPS